MSLYEISLYSIYQQIISKDLKLKDVLEILPEDITDELVIYLNITNSEDLFYESLHHSRLYFAENFINKIVGLEYYKILNNSLAYATNNETVKYLVDKGAYDWDIGLLGATVDNNLKMIEYFIEKGAIDF